MKESFMWCNDKRDIKNGKPLIIGIANFLVGLLIMTARAESSPCPYFPPEQWKSMAEIEVLAQQMGIEKFYVQPIDGCWGIYSQRQGREWLTVLDPRTGEKLSEGTND